MGLWDGLIKIFSDLLQYSYFLTVKIGIPSYGLAIIIITIAFKIVLYPLTVKQMKSMKAMQEIGPKVKQIQEKYKDKPEKSQQAVMELYKQHGVNPMAGCLPLLVQMPILIAFYQALLHFPYSNPEHAGFLWFVQNLSKPDPWVLPILAAATTFLQQKVTTTSNDPTQRTMLYVMPLFIGWMARSFPAGLALYWVVFNIAGTIQQIFINRMPVKVREEGLGK